MVIDHTEMERTASELRKKMVNLKTRRMVETEHTKTERIYNRNGDLSKIGIKGIIYSKLMIFSPAASIINFRDSNFHVYMRNTPVSAGFSNANLEDIQELLAEMKSMWAFSVDGCWIAGVDGCCGLNFNTEFPCY